jgi:hypothetical protein
MQTSDRTVKEHSCKKSPLPGKWMTHYFTRLAVFAAAEIKTAHFVLSQ